MKKYLWLIVMLLCSVGVAAAGELQKDYFGATRQGSWATYSLVTSDGTRANSSSQREVDQNGQVVVEEAMKIVAGTGAGTASKTIHVMPKNFNLARDWLSFGKFTEKMRMKGTGYDMPVDAATLATIKQGSKDFRGAVTFEGSEVVAGRNCDRYAYTVAIAGPPNTKEKGKVWLDPTLAFGIVRQQAQTINPDGSAGTSFELTLQETGQVQLAQAAAPAPAAAPAAPKTPAVATLLEAYQAGRVGIVVSVDPSSNGQRLRLNLVNKTDSALTVTLAAGPLDIPASSPVDTLKIVVSHQVKIKVPAGGGSEPIVVAQRPGRGALDGRFELSVYEGTLLFSGSVTKGNVTGK